MPQGGSTFASSSAAHLAIARSAAYLATASPLTFVTFATFATALDTATVVSPFALSAIARVASAVATLFVRSSWRRHSVSWLALLLGL